MISEEEYFTALSERIGDENLRKLKGSAIGVAGLGGLGSNIALLLARSGVGRLVIADCDTVELSNIHRQNYSLEYIGRKKTEAMADQIKKINPWCKVEAHDIRVTKDNISIFSDCDVICEAFDDAEQKVMLIESLSVMGKCIVSGNGMAGNGPANEIITKKVGNDIYLCGDGRSDVRSEGSLMPSRVAVCAAHQANAAIRMILGMEP